LALSFQVAALILENTFTSILDMAGVLLPFLKWFIGGTGSKGPKILNFLVRSPWSTIDIVGQVRSNVGGISCFQLLIIYEYKALVHFKMIGIPCQSLVDTHSMFLYLLLFENVYLEFRLNAPLASLWFVKELKCMCQSCVICLYNIAC